MAVSPIYVHDGKLLRVIEDNRHSRLMMEVELPILDRGEELEARQLVFEDVRHYHIAEGAIEGPPTLLDMTIVGQEGRHTKVRLDTTAGYREFLCSAVRVEPAAPPNPAPRFPFDET